MISLTNTHDVIFNLNSTNWSVQTDEVISIFCRIIPRRIGIYGYLGTQSKCLKVSATCGSNIYFFFSINLQEKYKSDYRRLLITLFYKSVFKNTFPYNLLLSLLPVSPAYRPVCVLQMIIFAVTRWFLWKERWSKNEKNQGGKWFL